jgi:alpha-tubulin suppressor-like RCC1 family protein
MDGFRVLVVVVASLIFSVKANASATLTDLIRELDDKQNSLGDLIPDAYQFSDGDTGININDGGNDMYDGANFINTNLAAMLTYTNGAVAASDAQFGQGSAYFTKKYPRFWVMGADRITIESFFISGDTGADGGGAVEAGQMVIDGYTVYFKRTFAATDPSINHLIFIPKEMPANSHMIDANNTNNDLDQVTGLTGVKDIYYLLFATANGGRVTDEVFTQVARKFMSVLKPSGAQHNCLARTGRLKCWGYNGYGQLGLGDIMNRGDAPNQMGTQLPYLDLGTGFEVAQFSTNGAHTCAVSRTGELKCWGLNESGQLGRGDTLIRGDQPNEMGNQLAAITLGNNGIPVIEASAGSRHTCALIQDGRVKCWGNNNSGQLGLGDIRSRGGLQREMGSALPYVDLGPNARAVHLISGREHNCALLANNTVKCWGSNASGQLGIGNMNNIGVAANQMGVNLAAVPLGTMRITKLVGGLDFNCVLFENGSIQCWGNNQMGQLALGDKNPRGVAPGEINSSSMAKLGDGQIFNDLACGGNHCCARSIQNTLKCWGANSQGQLGLGDLEDRGGTAADIGDELPFVETGVLTRVGTFFLGQAHTCAEIDGGLRCWGQNGRGQLGTGTSLVIGSTPATTPDQLQNIEIF